MTFLNKANFNELQKLFFEEFNKCVLNQDVFKETDLKIHFDDIDKQLEITLQHPVSEDYNIWISIKKEIIVFFNIFHNHFDNYSEEKTKKELVEGSINYIKELLTAQEIIITKLYKGKREFRYRLDIMIKNSAKVTLENYYVGFSGVIFFLPTKTITLKTSFIKK